MFQVEALQEKRVRGRRTEYLVKWEGWPEESNTWERASRIHPALVASFEGTPQPQPQPQPEPSHPRRPRRGAGCARARLSEVEERRGGVPQTISMVCGHVYVRFKQPKKERNMPVLKIVFFVLTMDQHGNVTWPIDFTAGTKASLRKQARVLL